LLNVSAPQITAPAAPANRILGKKPTGDAFVAGAELRQLDSKSVITTANDSDQREKTTVFLLAALAFGVWTSVSWLRWANFQYRTFDLAYYVQALWQLIHGRFSVSVENVPLLGNHVEPIILLFAPLFALMRHPMVFVAVQNAALALMGPVGYNLARRLGFDRRTAVCLAVAILITPATGYVALHEFHPEALAAPLLLLMIYSRITGRLWLHWLSFVGVLASKENMALVLSAYCFVFLILERHTGTRHLVRWYGAPLFVALGWFILCAKVITPAFNAGNIDYLSLYDRLGKNAGEIVWNAITRPQLVIGILFHSITHGNLVWALLLPFLGLPLLRPRWLLIASPILLQHLLSWRSSEWNVYFHYAAPLIPLFWIGAVEGLVTIRNRQRRATDSMEGRAPASPTGSGSTNFPGVAGAPPSIPDASFRMTGVAGLLVVGCVVGQIWIGPAGAIASELLTSGTHSTDRAHKEAFLAEIPANASVVAPLPYLSHLAMRDKLYSLHYILKGLKTLSRERYEAPPPPDFVFIDYGDSATFDAAAGFYHPTMRTVYGAIVPSSDQLLEDFLRGANWHVESDGKLRLFKKVGPNK
jgi:uncharacterized membrane protein